MKQKPLNLHPLCDAFPEMQPDEYEGLKKSIQEHGFDHDQPVIVFEGMILDGRHRAQACDELGIEYTVEEFLGNLQGALELVEQRNLHRRSMTASQRAMVAANLEPYYADAAKQRQRAGGLAPIGDKGTAAEHAAKAAGASARSTERAKAVAKADPELADRVRKGEVSLNKAVAEVKAKEPEKKPGRAPTRPEKPKDAEGRVIHPKAADAIAAAETFKELVSGLHALKREVLELPDDGAGRELNKQRIERGFKDLVAAIGGAAPYTSCPLSEDCTAKCKACHGSQWITEAQWKNVPKEFRR